MKSISIIASLLLAAAVSACGSLQVSNGGFAEDSGSSGPDILQQMAADSQGGE